MSPPSRRMSRYLPLRSTPVILWPSSLAMKCFLLGWRRIDRIPVTSTALIRFPTTSLSRSRRMVSTSGSSGIVLFRLRGHVVAGGSVGFGGRFDLGGRFDIGERGGGQAGTGEVLPGHAGG